MGYLSQEPSDLIRRKKHTLTHTAVASAAARMRWEIGTDGAKIMRINQTTIQTHYK